mmetsp:Transcript_35252/g.60910  ORF Transcript_35252/g.60910 Transcript_35252/m.60910 type:complete len:208 (+) Transcript_35252:202-825(+)
MAVHLQGGDAVLAVHRPIGRKKAPVRTEDPEDRPDDFASQRGLALVRVPHRHRVSKHAQLNAGLRLFGESLEPTPPYRQLGLIGRHVALPDPPQRANVVQDNPQVRNFGQRVGPPRKLLWVRLQVEREPPRWEQREAAAEVWARAEVAGNARPGGSRRYGALSVLQLARVIGDPPNTPHFVARCDDSIELLLDHGRRLGQVARRHNA